jgi:hypothetical protein
MGYIFVSYARDDSRKVRRVLEKFKAHGFEFWQDTNNIRTGKEWPEEITKAIVDCSRFLLFMSTASMSSDNVKREIQTAYENKKKIIILRLDSSKLNHKVSYQLIGIQRTDYLSSDWEDKIVSELGGSRKFFQKPKPSPSQPASSRITRSLPKKLSKPQSVITGLERDFAAPGPYYTDQCMAALSKLDSLLIVAGSHWINPALAYKELVPRQYLLNKIEVIRSLIQDFQNTCPPGSSSARQLIQNELRILSQELSRKANK